MNEPRFLTFETHRPISTTWQADGAVLTPEDVPAMAVEIGRLLDEWEQDGPPGGEAA